MSQFIYGSELNHHLVRLMREAQLSLIIVSPFIKLHPDLKDELNAKSGDANLHITIVFGKNVEDISKSLSIKEIEFFKQFPNLEIRYEKRLHAKYYANEAESILTSMNLYEYSLNNNIEFGVLSEQKLMGKNKLDSESIQYFNSVIDRAEIVYKQEANIEKSFGGLRKSFKGVNVIEDNLKKYYKNKYTVKQNSNEGVFENREKLVPIGYCIRTGVEINLNLKMPFSQKAHQSWNKYKNEEYPEKYCHFTGEPSNGETCFSKPILRKNWKEASKHFMRK